MPCKALCDYRSYVSINALGRDSFERVSSYRYLGIWVDDRLSFRLCIENLVKKQKVRLTFYYRNRACLNLPVRKTLVQAMLLRVIDYEDIIYMHAASSTLCCLDSVYHSSLRFMPNSLFCIHHCVLYDLVSWSSLTLRRQQHCSVLSV